MGLEDFEYGIFMVNCLGIIYNPKTNKVLIGRRENDPYLKELKWCFPGGRPKHDEELEQGLIREIKIKTGLKVKAGEVIFAKTYPEKRQLLSIYYKCEVIGGVEKAGESFVEIKWVNPEEVKNYFTTSLHSKILKYLLSLK